MRKGARRELSLFRWRRLLLSEHGPRPFARRHVLNVLSGYGDEHGRDIFPATDELARTTGMSQRRVEEHLREAEREGWIGRRPIGTGQGWRHMTYSLLIPENVRTERPDLAHERADGASEPPAERADVEGIGVRTERPLTSPDTSPSSLVREPETDLGAAVVRFCDRVGVQWSLKEDPDSWAGRLKTRYPRIPIAKELDKAGDWWEEALAGGKKKSLISPASALNNWLAKATPTENGGRAPQGAGFYR